MTFREEFYASGWQIVTDPKEHDCIMAAYSGAQCVARKGPVRVHIVWAVMYDINGYVHFCDPSGERPMSICAMVVDSKVRGQGHGREALRELVGLARRHSFSHVYVEPTPMGRKFKSPMTRACLASWYMREGFSFKKDSAKVMELVFKG